MCRSLVFILSLFISNQVISQANRWQQKVKYVMDIDMDVETHQYRGEQQLTYYNNSPEDLKQVFYHLYFNAFQPGSMMDVRSRTIEDPDGRVSDRISKLSPDEQGWVKVKSLTMNGKACDFKTVGTVLEVQLPTPIKAGAKVEFKMSYDAQVPIQIRRSGRYNAEGIEYSMSQWFPKMAEFDCAGWHADPYVAREFYAPWGDFEVNISIHKDYVVAASGVLSNPKECGHGYLKDESQLKLPAGDKLMWKFKAENLHDFMWAADKDYVHDIVQAKNGPDFHFFYQDDAEYGQNWRDYQAKFVLAFDYIQEHFGKYPYPVYVVAQGGDGGMEYPMSTLISGRRSVNSLLGVSVHEALHSWYQGILASNEALHEWMDEGFAQFAGAETMNHVMGIEPVENHESAFLSYFSLAASGKENPLSTHADHYETNYAYGAAAYTKGEVLVAQLEYVIGRDNLMRGMLKYFDTWKFKHPNPNDFKRIMEKESMLELDWYFQYFVNTTKTIDYKISSVRSKNGSTEIGLSRVGGMPMPIDVAIKFSDGSTKWFNIPMEIMRGAKPPMEGQDWTVLEDWRWTNSTYKFSIPFNSSAIEFIAIDPLGGMADVDRENNFLELNNEELIIQD